MSDPEPSAASSHWTALWSLLGSFGLVFVVQWFRYLRNKTSVEHVDGRVVLDNGWKTLFDSQNAAFGTAVASLESRIAALAAEHRECLEGQRVLRDRQDVLNGQIELLRAAISKPESVMLVTDHRGVVLTASESAVPFFKLPLASIVGRDCRQLMDESSWKRHVAAFEAGENRPPPRLTTGKAKDSAGVVFEVTVDTRRSFAGADGRWVYVAEIAKVRV